MFHSFKKFHRHVTATCCLFLAGKVEETPKKCKYACFLYIPVHILAGCSQFMSVCMHRGWLISTVALNAALQDFSLNIVQQTDCVFGVMFCINCRHCYALTSQFQLCSIYTDDRP